MSGAIQLGAGLRSARGSAFRRYFFRQFARAIAEDFALLNLTAKKRVHLCRVADNKVQLPRRNVYESCTLAKPMEEIRAFRHHRGGSQAASVHQASRCFLRIRLCVSPFKNRWQCIQIFPRGKYMPTFVGPANGWFIQLLI